MKKKFRVFTEVKVILEKEIEAEDAWAARDIAANDGYTVEELANGSCADDCVTCAEDTSTGELISFID